MQIICKMRSILRFAKKMDARQYQLAVEMFGLENVQRMMQKSRKKNNPEPDLEQLSFGWSDKNLSKKEYRGRLFDEYRKKSKRSWPVQLCNTCAKHELHRLINQNYYENL